MLFSGLELFRVWFLGFRLLGVEIFWGLGCLGFGLFRAQAFKGLVFLGLRVLKGFRCF